MASFSETQVTFRLPRRLAQRVNRLARRRGRKRSEVLREAVLVYVEMTEGTELERPFDRVVDLIGSVRSGIPDLGSRHSEYLKKRLGGGG
ncbi:MAG TPA: ribbon-helix-helix protein, CopG family [Polyangiaceae bacterium]|jgi:predicted DNA-binding protein